MHNYKVVDSEQLDSSLSQLANAIRAKSGSSDSLSFPSGMINAVREITTGSGEDVQLAPLDNAAQPRDMVQGKTLYNSDGEKVNGSLMEIDGVTPSYQTLPVSKDVTVRKVQDRIFSEGYLYSTNVPDGVIVRPDGLISVRATLDKYTSEVVGEATPEQVMQGVTFTSDKGFLLKGTHVCEGGIDTSDATATGADIAVNKTAYANGVKITGSLTDVAAGSALYAIGDPSVSLSANGDKVDNTGTYTGPGAVMRQNSKFKVRVPLEQYGDATASDVMSGKTFTSATGLLKGGDLIEIPAGQSITGNQNASLLVVGDNIVSRAEITSSRDDFTGAVVRPNAIAAVFIPKEQYGDATENDVREGVTFTSKNGVKLPGRASFDDSNGSSLPSGISNIKTGIWKPTQDYNTDYELNHNLGTIPALFYIYQEETDVFVPSSNKGYINCETLIFKPQPSASAYGTGLVTCGNSSGTSTSSYTLNITASPTNSTIKVKASSTYKFKAGTSYRWIAISF